MPAPAPRSSIHTLMPEAARDLQFALQAFSDLLSQRIEHCAADRREDMVPTLVMEAFAATLLSAGEAQRRRRAVLGCLLHGAELGGYAWARPAQMDASPDAPRTMDGEDPEMTSEGAAKLLSVSRTHLNSLIEAGELGAVRRTSGGHRRISKSAVLAYWARTKERQLEGLDEMIKASQRLGLYDAEIDDLPDPLKPIP